MGMVLMRSLVVGSGSKAGGSGRSRQRRSGGISKVRQRRRTKASLGAHREKTRPMRSGRPSIGSGGFSSQVLGALRIPGAGPRGFRRPPVLGIRMTSGSSWPPCPRRSSSHSVAPPHLRRLHIVRDHVFDGPRLTSLRNGERPGMSGEKRGCYAGEHQAGKHGYGEDILLDLLPPLWLGRTKDDALDFIVDPATSLERMRIRVGREIMEVCLEEPESLHWISSQPCVQRAMPTRRAPFTDSSHKSIMNSSSAMDSLLTLMRRWHSLRRVRRRAGRGAGRRTAGGRIRSPRRQTGAAWNRGHSGCRRDLHIDCAGRLSARVPAPNAAVKPRDLRKVRDGERRIVVEVIRLYEALKQIPTHRGRLIGAEDGRTETARPLLEKGAFADGASWRRSGLRSWRRPPCQVVSTHIAFRRTVQYSYF